MVFQFAEVVIVGINHNLLFESVERIRILQISGNSFFPLDEPQVEQGGGDFQPGHNVAEVVFEAEVDSRTESAGAEFVDVDAVDFAVFVVGKCCFIERNVGSAVGFDCPTFLTHCEFHAAHVGVDVSQSDEHFQFGAYGKAVVGKAVAVSEGNFGVGVGANVEVADVVFGQCGVAHS